LAWQGDSKLYLTEAADMAVVGCYCSEICECGVVQLRQSNDPDDEFHQWVDVQITPRWRLRERLRLAWDVLLRRTVSTGISWNRPTCVALGQWLIREPNWEPKPSREELQVSFRALKAWYDAGMPEIPDQFYKKESSVEGS
jgi:hypothetical protein